MTAVIDLPKPCDTIGCLNVVEFIRCDRSEEGATYLCAHCYAHLKLNHPALSADFKPIQQPLTAGRARMPRRKAAS